MSAVHVVVRAEEEAPLTQMSIAAVEATGRLLGSEVVVRIDAAAELAREARQLGAGAAGLLFVADDAHEMPADGGVPIVVASRAEAVRRTRALFERILGPVGEAPSADATAAAESADVARAAPAAEPAPSAPVFIVGVTSCPTGVAHTFMAAEALRRGAEALGYEVKVETRGSVGAKNELTQEDIARADAVIVAADARVETSRFAGKRLLETGTKAAIRDAQGLVRQALALPEAAALATAAAETPEGGEGPPVPAQGGGNEIYKHLMTGVSHMLPLVTAGGLMIALAFAVGGIYASEEEGTLGWAMMQIGTEAAFALFVPILAGFIAFSIADRPGLAPGLIGGMLAAIVGAGFLGGIAAGFLAGYFTRWLNGVVRLPETLQGLKPVLILPLISSLVVGLAMLFLIGPPVRAMLDGITQWLAAMQTSGALALGLLLGAMMAFDMGGPINKGAYTFAVGMVASQVYEPMAAVMAAGMTPPLGLAVAATLFKSRFTEVEQRAAKAAGVLGLSFITEGAIPFAAADPLRVIPCLVLGSAVAGGLSMAFDCRLLVPHGGIFVLAIPNAIANALLYLTAILAGTVTTAAALFFAKGRQ